MRTCLNLLGIEAPLRLWRREWKEREKRERKEREKREREREDGDENVGEGTTTAGYIILK